MNLAEGIEAVDLALYIPESKTLVLADFHIGFEESLESQGVLVPRFQLKDILARLKKIFDKVGAGNVRTIVINGDLKHEFGEISRQEWNDCLALIDFLAANCEQIILIKGNHDTILGPIARKRNLEVVDSYAVGDIFITHGHKLPEKELAKTINTILIGHEHSAISLTEAAKTERYKCFLKANWKDKAGSRTLTLIAQPSFNLVVEGSDIAQAKLLSPFLQKGASISNFEVFVVDDKKGEILAFGKLKNIC
jgi:hypothetical protein